MEGVFFLFFSFLKIQVSISISIRIRIRIRKKMYVLVASVKATSPLVSRGFSVGAMTKTCAWPTVPAYLYAEVGQTLTGHNDRFVHN
jgi:hypothetical protein